MATRSRSLPAQLDAASAPHRPDGHRPAVAAWTAVPTRPPTAIVFAQQAIQWAPGPGADAAAAAALHELEATLARPDGPALTEHAEHTDGAGHRNRILLSYWDDAAAHARWAQRPEVRRLWEDADPAALGALGRWREVATIAPQRVETLHSSDRTPRGAARLTAIARTDVHEYPGAMRDRMAISRALPLTSPLTDGLPAPREVASRGRRLRVTAPENVCFIRTAQDWSRCGPRERERYLGHVEPTLRRGAEYLRDEPAESGCISSRFVGELDEDGSPRAESCVLAWFRSLADLERWTHSHPTHLAILAEFFALVGEGDGQIDLALWHEVCTLPSDAVALEYLNCHPGTGFLPFLPAVET